MIQMIFCLKNLIKINKKFALAGDFNFFTGTKLEVMGRRPALKRKALVKQIEIKDGFELCEIWGT